MGKAHPCPGAYWLLDEIAFAQRADRRVAAEALQVITAFNPSLE
jgi:hypothetical protein